VGDVECQEEATKATGLYLLLSFWLKFFLSKKRENHGLDILLPLGRVHLSGFTILAALKEN